MPYTLYPTSYTLYPIPYTLYPISCYPIPIPYTLYSKLTAAYSFSPPAYPAYTPKPYCMLSMYMYTRLWFR